MIRIRLGFTFLHECPSIWVNFICHIREGAVDRPGFTTEELNNFLADYSASYSGEYLEFIDYDALVLFKLKYDYPSDYYYIHKYEPYEILEQTEEIQTETLDDRAGTVSV